MQRLLHQSFQNVQILVRCQLRLCLSRCDMFRSHCLKQSSTAGNSSPIVLNCAAFRKAMRALGKLSWRDHGSGTNEEFLHPCFFVHVPGCSRPLTKIRFSSSNVALRVTHAHTSPVFQLEAQGQACCPWIDLYKSKDRLHDSSESPSGKWTAAIPRDLDAIEWMHSESVKSSSTATKSSLPSPPKLCQTPLCNYSNYRVQRDSDIGSAIRVVPCTFNMFQYVPVQGGLNRPSNSNGPGIQNPTPKKQS